jgi:hypothetical protein
MTRRLVTSLLVVLATGLAAAPLSAEAASTRPSSVTIAAAPAAAQASPGPRPSHPGFPRAGAPQAAGRSWLLLVPLLMSLLAVITLPLWRADAKRR